MMHIHGGITTPTGIVTRAFARGTYSFGAHQNGRTHTAI